MSWADQIGASPTAIAQRIYKLRQKAKELLESEDEDEDEDDESDEEEMPAGNHPNGKALPRELALILELTNIKKAATPDKAALAGVGVAAPTKKRVKNPKNLRITPPSPGSDVDDIVIVKKGKEGPTVPSRLLKPGASKAVSLEEEKKKKKKKAVQIGRVGKKRAPARFGINGRIV